MVSRELNVRQVLAKVVLGEADAGIVYRSDALAAKGKGKVAIAVVEIPPELNVTAAYPIAALKAAPSPDLARAFIDLVRSPAGAAVLREAGFVPCPESVSAAPPAARRRAWRRLLGDRLAERARSPVGPAPAPRGAPRRGAAVLRVAAPAPRRPRRSARRPGAPSDALHHDGQPAGDRHLRHAARLAHRPPDQLDRKGPGRPSERRASTLARARDARRAAGGAAARGGGRGAAARLRAPRPARPGAGGGGNRLAVYPRAVVVAQTFVAAPFYLQAAIAAFRRLDPDLILVARTLGASPPARPLHRRHPGLLAQPGRRRGDELGARSRRVRRHVDVRRAT